MAGSFWGLNDAAKNARNRTRQFADDAQADAGEWGRRSSRYSDLSDFYTNGSADYWGGRREDGFGTPGQVTATGREISPWVQPYNENALARRAAIRAAETGRRTAGEVEGEMSGRIDEMGQAIGGNFTNQEDEINSTSGRMFGRNEGASGDVVGNIRDTSGSLRGAVSDTFGGLRGDNAGTYGGIKGRGKTSFADQIRNLALIAPGGQAQSARVGRSFAPQVADTMARMRRMGIDPNSPEAAALLGGVETNRSRAMDDATANATESFVRQSNDVSNAELGFMTAADRARLENEASLGIGQVDRANEIGAREGDAFQREKLRAAGAANEIDRDRSGRTSENTDLSFRRGQDLLADRNNLSQWGRTAGMQDVDRINAVTQDDDAQELQAGNLLNNQFDRGVSFTGINQQTRDNAVNNLGAIGRDYRVSMFQSGNQAQNNRNAGAGFNQSVYDSESANAGWGGRLLGGIAAAGMNYFAPGTGSAFAGAMGGGGGGGGRRGGGQQGGWPGGGGGATPQVAGSHNSPGSFAMPSFVPLRPPARPNQQWGGSNNDWY